MNINRLRPTGVKRENLDVWLSSVVHDAIRDAEEAGMPPAEIYQLLQTVTDMHRPYGYRRNTTMPHKIKPATLFDVRSFDNKSKGTLLIADFGDPGDEPSFMATLAPPPFAAPPGFRVESAAVRALRDQLAEVMRQLDSIAGDLERNGR